MLLFLLMAACSDNNPPQPQGGWVCYGCKGMTLSSNGNFSFPDQSGAVGYIYTSPVGLIQGKTAILNYAIAGMGTIKALPASGNGDAQVRLFLWRKGDDMTCSSTTEWYRWWARNGAGLLTEGQHSISALIDSPQWTDCFGKQDASQFAGTLVNPLGIGFSFGAEFYGHGVYSTGSNSFTINSFTVQ